MNPSKPSRIAFLGIVLVVLVVLLAALELTNTTHLLHNQKVISGTIPSTTTTTSSPPTKDKANDAPAVGTTDGAESPKQGDATTSAPPSGSAPITPFGNFVSNHSPNLDGKPAPSSVQSVCNTTPGATCYIEFTNQNGVIKTLASQKTDSSGATFWTWDVKQAGFSTGTWKIKVIASINGQTSTENDAQNLEVGP